MFSGFIRSTWWLIHLFRPCPAAQIRTVLGAWNPAHPNHITARHQCRQCGRAWSTAMLYPPAHWTK